MNKLIEQQLEQVAKQNGMSLDTLEWEIFRKVEIENWKEDIIFCAKETFELENLSEEFIETALARLDHKYDTDYRYWDNIESAIEWTIQYLKEKK